MPDRATFIRDGYVVLDANVLLHLYRVTPAAREQIFAALTGVESRLWIPHQAAIEFHHNRINVVHASLSQFRDVRQVLKQAADKAVAEMRKAVLRFRSLQQASMTERQWDTESNGLDKESISSRLDGIMDGALSELAEMEAEHDLRPRDIQSGDPVLQRLEALTIGRIGEPYDNNRLRLLVEEATSFRFPNEIPPGYKDANTKPNPYRAAGDYILWHQVLDYAARSGADRLMALVTNDIKEDWWVLDSKGRPVDGRPELKQELFEHSGSLMTQMMLSDFLAEVSSESPEQVSPATVTEVRESEVVAQIEDIFSDQPADLMTLNPFEFEHLVRQLLEAMGYVARITEHSNDLGFDIDARRATTVGPHERTIVQAKRYRNVVPTTDVRALYATVLHLRADQGILVTTSWFGDSARRFVKDKSLTLIDGPELRRLLREHLGMDVTIPRRISRRPIDSVE